MVCTISDPICANLSWTLRRMICNPVYTCTAYKDLPNLLLDILCNKQHREMWMFNDRFDLRSHSHYFFHVQGQYAIIHTRILFENKQQKHGAADLLERKKEKRKTGGVWGQSWALGELFSISSVHQCPCFISVTQLVW